MNINPNSKYKIQFLDCDMFEHLNNSRYLDSLINAREDHLKDFYNFDFNEYYKNNLAWVISSHEIIYLRPAVFIMRSRLIPINIITGRKVEHNTEFMQWAKTIQNITINHQ